MVHSSFKIVYSNILHSEQQSKYVVFKKMENQRTQARNMCSFLLMGLFEKFSLVSGKGSVQEFSLQLNPLLCTPFHHQTGVPSLESRGRGQGMAVPPLCFHCKEQRKEAASGSPNQTAPETRDPTLESRQGPLPYCSSSLPKQPRRDQINRVINAPHPFPHMVSLQPGSVGSIFLLLSSPPRLNWVGSMQSLTLVREILTHENFQVHT